MQLLVVSQYFWPENFRINELVATLIERGHEVTVLTGVPNYPSGRVDEAFRRDPKAFADYRGARIVRVPMRPRGQGALSLMRNYWSFVFWASLLGPWRLRGQRFDAIFVYEISPVTVALPAIALRRGKRAPLLMWVLDLWPDTLAAVGVVRSPQVLRMVGWLVRFIYRRCDRILVQSRAFAENVRAWSGEAERIRYFPAWAEAVFDRPAERAADELQSLPQGFRILFAGNIGEAQDFPAILDAAVRLRHRSDIQWVIVGDGRSADLVRQEIDRRGLAATVHMLGRFPLERMPEFFRGADALLVSLRPEPIFGMTIPGKVQSYLAVGIPLVAMLDGEGARVIAESGGGLVGAAGDSAALAANVERLADMDTADRREMGERAQRYGRAEFDRETQICKLEQWMLELHRPLATKVP